jgi:hypothetical protein
MDTNCAGSGDRAAGLSADLARRIAAIDWRASAGRIGADLAGIRAQAARHDMLPVVTVARALESALARGERGPLVHGWLALLREAAASVRQDAAASQAFAAACAVRLAA